LLLLAAFAKQYEQRRPDIAKTSIEGIKILRGFSRRIEADPFVAGFIGLSNVGKSTLLNALFGMGIAPRKNRPMTSSPVEYSYADEFRVLVEYADTFERADEICADAESLLDCIEKYATEEGPHATSEIKKVSASVPSDILQGGLVIADTPGFGAAQVGMDEGLHESILLNFLPNIHQLFWVVLFEQGITSREAEFYAKHLKGNCADIIVTGSEETTINDQRRFVKLFERKLDLHLVTFHFLSGKEAWNGKKKGDANQIEKSGIRRFESRLKQMSSPVARLLCLNADIVKFAQDLGVWLRTALSTKEIDWPQTVVQRVFFAAKTIPGDSSFVERLAVALK